ncbi:putative cyanamide hydratase [Aspergillus clavatus NRRL 1]|uniref:Cyanamide hydratase, putative n=1 Tax=Aspergillus clavatus (strain ATCC 1007 / CBS 513.65 / DSM 816 / NCTC 3887 / NRRL 1 / QM 1276 / 107) TaxID=344612 RepID=A1CDV1_ASPCL|nr:cyanamide hydratase, putative [Aspergillus clavatus NRRL 1]EAW12028.1 cyanamide hydratase, putative [Aspergillus clavatus NRRL 1]
MCHQEVTANGWTSMPVNAGATFGDQPFINKPENLPLRDIEFPFDEPVVAKTLKYAKEVLHPETLNHSMRVYFYGMAISKQQFPEHAAALSPVTWALTCLLHDLGTAEQNLTATRMSFDLYGGIKALSVLEDFGATTDQAEAAAEAIIRHQDLGVDGTITYIGQLVQLATIYDNIGVHPHVRDFEQLIHKDTRAEINEAYPRHKWCTIFAGVIRTEEKIKPWCHSTHLVNFANEVEANTLMKQWE